MNFVAHSNRLINHKASPFCFYLFLIFLTACSASPNSQDEHFSKYLDGAGKEKIEKILEDYLQENSTRYVEQALKEIISKRGDSAEVSLEERLKNRKPITTDGGASRGPDDAPITIVEFIDYKDSHSQKGMITIQGLLETYPNQIRWVIRHNPLSVHQSAIPTHIASMAAQKQSKFWEFHNRAMTRQLSQNKENFLKWAKEFGMKIQTFEKDLNNPSFKARLEKDKKAALELGNGAVPLYFVNGVLILGAQPPLVFTETIDALLKEKGIDPKTVKKK